MDFFGEPLMLGLAQLLQPSVLLYILAGTLVGLVFGVIPGLQSVTALSIFLPITYWWDPVLSMYFFAGIIGSAANGGAITSILLNMPGTAQNAATMLEGFPLTRQGKAVFALNVSACASGLGAVFGVLVLIIFLPLFVPVLLSFGPAEIFWIGVFGLVTLILAISSNVAKGLVAVGMGLMFSTVGLGGPNMPVPRFTFGSVYLLDGLNLVVVVIGLLVVSEAFMNLVQTTSPDWGRATGKGSGGLVPLEGTWRKQMEEGLRAPFRHIWVFIRSSAIGTFVGALPGVGGTVAQFMSYNAAVASSRHPEKFGKGSVEGLVATEAATNAKDGGALFPTLLFGIPGSADMALVLAAWQLHGLQPGPLFLETNADLAWALILGLLLSNIINSIITVLFSPVLSRVPGIDIRYVAPIVLVTSMVAVYAIRGNFWDIVMVIAFGLFGFFQKSFGFPIIGTVIGFVLGGVIEFNFYFALQSSLGTFAVFVGSTISIVLMLLTMASALWCFYKISRRPVNSVLDQASSDE
jgi:putative tricarboxylic transport membrane protein